VFADGALPLILIYFRTVHFVNKPHRNIPRLRHESREPVLEIRPVTAVGLGVGRLIEAGPGGIAKSPMEPSPKSKLSGAFEVPV
jgi:hypothetical protein